MKVSLSKATVSVCGYSVEKQLVWEEIFPQRGAGTSQEKDNCT